MLQGLGDNHYLFKGIFLRWTEKPHDAKILKISSLYKECQRKCFLPTNMLKQIGNEQLSPLIQVDLAYFLENWLMKPYSDGGSLNPDEARFNIALNKNRVVVENAFGCLECYFQHIAKRLNTTLEHSANIVTTCCFLHIFCKIAKERFLHKWLEQTDVDLVQNRSITRCVKAVNEAESMIIISEHFHI